MSSESEEKEKVGGSDPEENNALKSETSNIEDGIEEEEKEVEKEEGEDIVYDLKDAERRGEKTRSSEAIAVEKENAKITKQEAQKTWRQKLKRVQMALTFRTNARTEAYKRRAQETAIILRSLVPKYLQWCTRKRYFDNAWVQSTATASEVEGVVVFIDLKGYTKMTEHLSKNVGDTGSMILDRMNLTVDHSAEFANQVVSKYWELVVSFVHRFHGDVVKFLGDGLQIMFPIDPVFSEYGEEAELKCKRRAVLFALELLQALRTFEIDTLNLGFRKMMLKIGLSYGRAYGVILGGICRRYEFILTGEPVARASHLSEVQANENAAILDHSIATAVGLEIDSRFNHSILRLETSKGPNKDAFALLEQLLAEVHEEDIETYCCPYTNTVPGATGTLVRSFTEKAKDFHDFRRSVATRTKLKDRLSSCTTDVETSRSKSRTSSCERFDVAQSRIESRELTEEVKEHNSSGSRKFSSEELPGILFESEEKFQERLQWQRPFLWNLFENDANAEASFMFQQQEGDAKTEQQHEQSTEEASTEPPRRIPKLNEMDILGGFVPIYTLSQVVSGQAESHFGARFVSILFIEVLDFQANAPLDLDKMQLAATEAQISIYSHFGDLRQIAMDDKGFVIIGVFGISGKDPEESACMAAFELSERFNRIDFRAGIGIATGTCHFGMTGSPYRGEFTVAGSPVNLAARLMSKASKVLQSGASLSSQCFVFIEDETHAGLSEDLRSDVPFGHLHMNVKGWAEAVSVYFPSEENVMEEELQIVHGCLGDVSPHHSTPSSIYSSGSQHSVVKLGMGRSRGQSLRKKKAQYRRRSSSVSIVLDQLQGSDSTSEVLKHVAVMATVNEWIEVDVLHSVLHTDFVRFDLEYALNALGSRFGVLEKVNDNLFKASNSNELLDGLYQSLLVTFRSCMHAQLATVYEERSTRWELRNPPYDYHEVIATHFALAGDEYHLRAAEHYNHSSLACGIKDLKRVQDLSRKAQSLVSSWLEIQQLKAERVQGQALCQYARMCRAKLEKEAAFQSFTEAILVYRNLFDLFGKEENKVKQLKAMNAVLLIHFMDDSNSFSFQFRCLHYVVKDPRSVDISSLHCMSKVAQPKKVTFSGSPNCVVEDVDLPFIKDNYNLSDAALSIVAGVKTYYRVVIPNAITSRNVLYSLSELAKLSSAEYRARRRSTRGSNRVLPQEVALVSQQATQNSASFENIFQLKANVTSKWDQMKRRVGCSLM